MFIALLVSILLVACSASDRGSAAVPPNVVVILLDDSGYGDFHPFGAPSYPTPNVERLAEQGKRLNRFYVPQAICSASRAALLSGCYPGRSKVFGAHGPKGAGLGPEFMTIAEMLKARGYATAHFGKWHCGDQPETRPLARGFDEHAGLMYSNDMWQHHPVAPEYWGQHPLQFWENGEVAIPDVTREHQAHLTEWATANAVDFIGRQAEGPFFLYLAHSMPHVPLFCGESFRGKSGDGLYGDVIMELDWSVGQVMAALAEAGVDENTLVLFSSDNGPWADYGDHAGVTPFRAHKATSFDGGVRSATVIKYPRELEPGTELDQIVSSVDLMPTLAHLTGAALPENPVDGVNAWSLIRDGAPAAALHEYHPISTITKLESVISGDGRWKLHLPHGYSEMEEPGSGGTPGKSRRVEIEWSLFDLENDPLETTNVIDDRVEVAERLKGFAKSHQSQFYD